MMECLPRNKCGSLFAASTLAPDFRYVCAENVAWPSGPVADCLVFDTEYLGKIVGHEILTCRRDWVVEMCNVGNSAPWRGFCHQWFAVAADEFIVADGELPDGWGLLVPGPSGLRMPVSPSPVEHPKRMDAATMGLVRQAAAITPQDDFARAG